VTGGPFPGSSQIDSFAVSGEASGDFEAFLEHLGQSGARAIFAVSEKDSRFGGGKRFEPLHQFGLARMATEAVQRVDLGLHRQTALVDRDQLLAVDKPSAKRAIALVADNHHMGAWFREIVPQMVEYAASVAHAGTRKN
jgi:hypothetical protein